MFPYRVACGLLKSMLCGALCICGLIEDPGYVFLTKDQPLKAVPALETTTRFCGLGFPMYLHEVIFSLQNSDQ